MGVTHTFVSTKPAAADPTQVGSAEWNAAHTVSIANADVAADAAIAQSKLDIANAATGVTGLLTGADWDAFNGKQSALTFPLAANLGGTGIANAAGSTLTLGAATSITGGGTLALGGFTLTVPATGTAALLAVDNLFTGNNSFTRGTALTNTMIGNAGNATMTATGCTLIGSGAGPALTDGVQNFLLGSSTGNALTTGSNNVAIGHAAMRLNVTGIGNIIIGQTAGGYTGSGGGTDPDNNVVIGNEAAYKLTGDFNIILGYRSGRWETGSSKLIIDTTTRADNTAELQNAYLYGSMAAGGYLQLNIPTTTNNAVKDTLKLQAYVSTASTGAAAGFGVGLPFLAETATDATYQQQGLISTSWIDATNATRKAKMSLSAYDTAARLGIEIEADGSAVKLGFYGVATVARATTGIAEAAFTENAGGTAVNVDSTFGGYTLQQIAQALQNIGILT